ncbi:MAG: exodeoxyribonuclease VII small subunit [Granulosicoccus sp.]
MSQKTRKIPKSTKFEDALSELETIVESLESGEQTLEASLEQFERGVSLSRFCQQSLSEAEQKVKILLSDSDESDDGLTEFETADPS